MSKEKNLDMVNAYTKEEDLRLVEKEEFRKVKDDVFDIDKKNLPAIIEKRKKEVIEEIQAYIEEHKIKRITYSKLYDLMSSGNAYNRTNYSAGELYISFEVYKSLTSDLTLKNPKHAPTRQSFCNFIGVSSQTYAQWKLSQDSELVEVINKVDDFLTDVQLTMAQNGLLNPGATMFRMKTEHGYVEPKDFIQITNEIDTDRSEIRQRLLSVKGKN